ncbi:MAG: ABC transporter permease [Actinomycetes bacterium]
MDYLKRLGNSLLAPLLALGLALAVTSIILVAFGSDVVMVFQQMWGYGSQASSIALILNLATTYYLSAVAVAIGFKMNLFNIGVNGQYLLGGMAAAAVAGHLSLPSYLAIPITIFVAIVVAGAWAGIAGWLKVSRGVSEVISTIMLNFIALGVISYTIIRTHVGEDISVNVRGTRTIPKSGWMPGFKLANSDTEVYGFIFVALLVGIGYWFVLNRTRFGYDLRASGMSPSAALASGVDSKKMIAVTMLISGGIAGLVALPDLLGSSHTYTLNFPTGFGFTGIAIALIGRNNPLGIAFGALLWAFLDVSSQQLDLVGVPQEIVTILQGVTVLAVVIAYEIVRRNKVKAQQRDVGLALANQEVGA